MSLATKTSAEQADFYYKETDSFWTVIGASNPINGQGSCFGDARRNDGSIVQIHRSLVDGELWVLIHGTEWQIPSQDGGTLRWNFYGPGNKDSFIAGTDYRYEVKDKNTILILGIKPNAFSTALWNSRYFVIVMPSNMSNIVMSFESKGATMLTALAECIKQNEKTFKDTKPPLENVPDSVKQQL